MKLNSLYTTTKNSNDLTSFHIHLNKSHKIYKGHFPNHPVTPGVVLLQILKDLVELKLNKKVMMKEATNIKFLNLVKPNENPELIYNYSIEMFENEFKIKNITTFPDGRLVLKCNAIFV